MKDIRILQSTRDRIAVFNYVSSRAVVKVMQSGPWNASITVLTDLSETGDTEERALFNLSRRVHDYTEAREFILNSLQS